MGENAVQAVKNSSTTKKNRDALKESLAGDARQEKLFKLVDTVDTNGSPKYSDAELIWALFPAQARTLWSQASTPRWYCRC